MVNHGFFYQNLICLQFFDALTSPTDFSFSHAYFWVQLYHLPFGCMNSTVVLKLGKMIGNLVHVEIDDNGTGWGPYMCILVEIDLFKPLARGSMLSLHDHQVFVAFKYERLPHFYFSCGGDYAWCWWLFDKDRK